MSTESGSRTVGRVVELIDLIATKEDPQRLVDILREVNIPPSSVHLLLKELCRTGMLQFSEDKRYSAGPALVALALQVVSRERIIDVASPLMVDLASRAGEDVILALPTNGTLIFAHRVTRPGKAPRLSVRLGRPDSLQNTAAGQLFLALLPPDERERMLDSFSWPTLTEHTITDRTAMSERLATTAKRGWAMTDREALPFVVTIAGPVYGRGEFAAALAVPLVTERHPERVAEVRDLLLETCAELSDRLSNSTLPD